MNIDLRYPQNDVAVIKLIQSVGNNVIPAPISNIQNYNALSGEDIVLVGWGESNDEDIPDILQSGTLKIITNEECSNLASELQGWRIRIPTRYICTRADPLIRLLGGDCGGPILYQGSIIGVSKGVFPTDQELCDDAVNFHVGIHYYIGFITHLLAL
ncbi:PREDICTED: chymotrypsin-2-like [Ceratosolen solmsi marchali]|uniref:Chymotrypsin-2-like n=1 Tax=Ceratosolen solmsi marchali TaxID=326594 RepID=A0AAJ7DVR6_9HYME|nr:PREDICTED: chymotrypsin-2-like [Ceratosolen solmsi marchali]